MARPGLCQVFDQNWPKWPILGKFWSGSDQVLASLPDWVQVSGQDLAKMGPFLGHFLKVSTFIRAFFLFFGKNAPKWSKLGHFGPILARFHPGFLGPSVPGRDI